MDERILESSRERQCFGIINKCIRKNFINNLKMVQKEERRVDN